jgi:hypothetical protein
MNSDFPKIILKYSYLAGGILIVLGVLLILANNSRQREEEHILQACSEQTEGVVSDIYVEEVLYDDEDGKYVSRLNYPVFQYEAGGQTYSQQPGKADLEKQFEKGQTVTVWFNPDNPDEYYLAETFELISDANKIGNLVFNLFLIIFGMVPIVLNTIRYYKGKL